MNLKKKMRMPKKKMKQVMVLFNFKMAVVMLLALASTCMCLHFEVKVKLPLALMATAVIFPIVFTISGAYKRRENALGKYSSMKAHGRAIYFAARDWVENPEDEVLARARDLLGELLGACRLYFSSPLEETAKHEDEVYRIFSKLSLFIREDLRQKGMAGGEVSRCNQFLSKMIIAFEDVKHIYQYRTPRSLSAFSDIFVTVLPVVYGPFFAELTKDMAVSWLAWPISCLMAVLFSSILISLDNIQEHLENPFDQVGEDDIRINAEKFVERLQL